ncbi:hypothetical protein VSS74_00860 [Conexibacter stalactiti]|uniref:DNA-binding protein n=1 Tax=Conexibacter stalactiti TaxID=1940611 RepID=A0ABU4HJL7_9ACTN|nr:hypothetical protein [Conexibacter stalactiti]MDW5592867.1 hypothetical protein [Conexibacter stalactiti]MEC5033508.1 hypothetical protein [Conexibacter stalactiti]
MSALRELDRLLAADRIAAGKLPERELRTLREETERLAAALESPAGDLLPAVSSLTGERMPTPVAVAIARRANLRHSFELRRAVLADTLSVGEVAETLGIGRQSVHDRIRHRTLLAVKDHDRFRLPAWQFDAAQPSGTLVGLAQVLGELRDRPLNPFAQLVWFTTPKRSLRDRAPFDALAAGDLADVLAEARTVGAA